MLKIIKFKYGTENTNMCFLNGRQMSRGIAAGLLAVALMGECPLPTSVDTPCPAVPCCKKK